MSAYLCPYTFACKCLYVCVHMYHVRMQARMHVRTVMVMVITASPLHAVLYVILVA